MLYALVPTSSKSWEILLLADARQKGFSVSWWGFVDSRKNMNIGFQKKIIEKELRDQL